MSQPVRRRPELLRGTQEQERGSLIFRMHWRRSERTVVRTMVSTYSWANEGRYLTKAQE